jgi:predicted acyl esterase
MNVLRSNYVFPSYSKIKQEIVDKRSKAYERTITRLNQKLTDMGQQNNFQQDHDKIKNCIISLSAQNLSEKTPLEKENLAWAHQRHQSNPNNQESLNYYIEDDKEEENNYETYLKFKKKALERDLEEDRHDKLSGKEKKKQEEEEVQLFKMLYNDVRDSQDHPRTKTHQFDYNAARNHAQHSRKADRFSGIKRKLRESKPFVVAKQRERTEEEMHLVDYREKMIYEKNKKFLTDNYMEILKKLDSTNIVKWRILNTPDTTL